MFGTLGGLVSRPWLNYLVLIKTFEIMKLSKYEQEMQDNTNLLKHVIFTDPDKLGYKDKLIKLYNSPTFNASDFTSVIYSIAHAHNIDITRINCTEISIKFAKL